jgi:hypothetical protein
MQSPQLRTISCHGCVATRDPGVQAARPHAEGVRPGNATREVLRWDARRMWCSGQGVGAGAVELGENSGPAEVGYLFSAVFFQGGRSHRSA